MFLALIEPGSYLEFGRDVPFQEGGRAGERGLLDGSRLNNGRAIQFTNAAARSPACNSLTAAAEPRRRRHIS
jgi:hypothetical protein